MLQRFRWHWLELAKIKDLGLRPLRLSNLEHLHQLKRIGLNQSPRLRLPFRLRLPLPKMLKCLGFGLER
jgi:hypothetical protein